jgi:hypothetical protein
MSHTGQKIWPLENFSFGVEIIIEQQGAELKSLESVGFGDGNLLGHTSVRKRQSWWKESRWVP